MEAVITDACNAVMGEMLSCCIDYTDYIDYRTAIVAVVAVHLWTF